ncbi:hypothetical protein HNO88_002958 [Novosphingobium chloroacetimidivorans]|uniref:Uncharacterized protein n=1 Tax=Novosphingobium chloroacetimidivorans TaxID=1428314 RepID=A0A7W7KCA2_9SPHN|nr:hypothetical protein [Novosphingobium chloroacetimidivorans]MBB4859629.1 hypothetical protein [Novosphingobium chloroacetimidivorans]
MFRSDVRGPTRADFDQYRRYAIQTFERAAVRSVAAAARRGKADVRGAFGGAGLARLGNAIDARGEERVTRFAGDRFSVSAQFFIRSRSERTLGAIKAYTEGASIRPVRSRWLWIPTDNIRRLAGSNRQGQGQRMTPALWRERGFESRIGPLVLVPSVNGNPLLVLKNVGVDLSGRKRGAKSLTKKGLARRGQVEKQFVVAFVGIPWTARAARVNVTAILNNVRAALPEIFATELEREAR